jgi:hypothetical protein
MLEQEVYEELLSERRGWVHIEKSLNKLREIKLLLYIGEQ